MLTNFKNLANSCLHTSKLASNHNTRKICNMADVVQWHLRRVAACVLVLFYVNHRRRNRKRWKNRKFWTKPYISRNSSLGAYNTLVQELRTEDAAAFKNFLRMDQTCFDELLEMVKPQLFHFCLLVLSIFVRRRRNVPQIGTIVNFFEKTKRCVPFLKSVRHFAMITQNT